MGIGTFITTLPFIEMFNRFGVKWPFFFGAILSAVATAAIPFAAEFNIWSVGLMRFLQVFWRSWCLRFFDVNLRTFNQLKNIYSRERRMEGTSRPLAFYAQNGVL